MKSEINLQLFAAKIKEKRGKLTFKDAAAQIGKITGGTLARAENENLPDLNTFIRICRWLDLPTDAFVIKKIRITPPTQTAYLKAPELSYSIYDGNKVGRIVTDEGIDIPEGWPEKFIKPLPILEGTNIVITSTPPEDLNNIAPHRSGVVRPNPYDPQWVQNLDAILPEPSYDTDLIGDIEKDATERFYAGEKEIVKQVVNDIFDKGEAVVEETKDDDGLWKWKTDQDEEVPLQKAAKVFEEKIAPVLDDLERANADEDLNQIIDMP